MLPPSGTSKIGTLRKTIVITMVGQEVRIQNKSNNERETVLQQRSWDRVFVGDRLVNKSSSKYAIIAKEVPTGYAGDLEYLGHKFRNQIVRDI